ncbi:MAG: undecaprenyldiphospho-muramoylpentapeptide beta-N-acetylglucosaminyltransferase [Deltaproteobacteria bacterium]|nr:undecaprenyldiphospho-muramoylpentapeptide beta-N-acetylglucosaminyltransferase [Deltaproteobacteria bacterium]
MREIETGEKKLKIIIAGGGTGGHLFPGIAVGNEFRNRDPGTDILFVTAGRELETQILEKAGFRQECLLVQGIKGKGIKETLIALFKLPLSLFQSLSIIRKTRPDIVLGVGGYSSGPLCLAGRLMGRPVVIHEQNSYPGVTNRLLSRIADRVFISFEESRDYFPSGTILMTGNPVREVFKQEARPPAPEKGPLTIFVTGGSQGAVAVNTLFIEALAVMKEEGILPEVIHHSGYRDYERVQREYTKKGLKGLITPFIDNMREAYDQADLFIGRAGAGTIFELAAMGRPSILIPLPDSANNHQESNAMALVSSGGAIMLEQKNTHAKMLAEKIIELNNNRGLLVKMGECCKKKARPDAARDIADEMCRLTGRNPG